MTAIGTIVLGAIMLFYFFNWINEERTKENKEPLGCFYIILISVLIIVFWFLTS